MRLKKKARDRIALLLKHGLDLHPCPECGELCRCELAMAGHRHYCTCPEHGLFSYSQAEVTKPGYSFYLPPAG